MEADEELQTVLKADIEAGDFNSGGEVSSKLKDLLRKLGIPAKIVRKVAIIAYELEMNIIIHSLGGQIQAQVKPELIKVIAEDKGPGIENVEQAFQPGYSTASESIRELGFGAGMGLYNVENYSDDLAVTSEVDKGTKIESYIKFEA